MFNLITTALDIVGGLIFVVALALVASNVFLSDRELWALAVGLGVGGLGSIAMSFLLTRKVPR